MKYDEYILWFKTINNLLHFVVEIERFISFCWLYCDYIFTFWHMRHFLTRKMINIIQMNWFWWIIMITILDYRILFFNYLWVVLCSIEWIFAKSLTENAVFPIIELTLLFEIDRDWHWNIFSEFWLWENHHFALGLKIRE